MFLLLFRSGIFGACHPPFCQYGIKTQLCVKPYLHCEGPQNDGAEDGVAKYSIKDVSLSVDLARIDLVEKLHEDEGVKNDGVVLRGRGVERSVAAAVDVKHALTWRAKKGEVKV